VARGEAQNKVTFGVPADLCRPEGGSEDLEVLVNRLGRVPSKAIGDGAESLAEVSPHQLPDCDTNDGNKCRDEAVLDGRYTNLIYSELPNQTIAHRDPPNISVGIRNIDRKS
jgi:hypothetical protein